MEYKPISQETAYPQKTKDAVKSSLCCHCPLFPAVLLVITLGKPTRGEGKHQDEVSLLTWFRGPAFTTHLTGPSSAWLGQPARSLGFQQLLDAGAGHADGADCGGAAADN